MTIKINEEHLGDLATEQYANDMIDCLKAEGIDVEYGNPRHEDERAENVPDNVWDKCLDTVNRIMVIDNKYK